MDPRKPLGRTDEQRGSPAPVGAVLIGLSILLALVALGARRHVGAATTEAVAIGVDAGAVLRPMLWTLAGLLLALVVMVLWPGGRKLRLPVRRRRPWWYPLLAVVSVMLIALVLGPVLESLDVPQAPVEAVPPASADPQPAESAPPWRWLVLASVVVLSVTAVVAGTRRRSRSALPAGLDEGEGEVAEVVSPPCTEQAPAGGDPRARVIRDYAEMERAFAGLPDLARRPHETAGEFLRRTGSAVPAVRRPADRLTHLFEVARFSRARVDETMAADADAALDGVVGELGDVR